MDLIEQICDFITSFTKKFTSILVFKIEYIKIGP